MYCFNALRRSQKPIHILFCNVDHYEPGIGDVPSYVEKERLTRLITEYPKLVRTHKDSSGNVPRRTWFFPPHIHRNDNLRRLVSLCERGYGEIELHLHHGKREKDNAENLRKTIEQCIEEYGYFGIFGTEDKKKRYGFIHGDWALDNSRKGRFCGVNNEIQILKETGCYADFTFPSLNEANPFKINSIFYATDNPKKPKSYNRGIAVQRSRQNKGDLILIQGPIHPFFKNKNPFGLRVLGDSINSNTQMNERRVDLWVKTGIHIKGQRNWIIIKTHIHGAADADIVLGKEMDKIYKYIETKYNDGEDYLLHYVSARELYNIIKAIEDGKEGENPEEYRNYKIMAPKYDSSPEVSEASPKLKEFLSRTYSE